MKLFVGNLSLDTTDVELRAAFEPFGEVASASVIKDRNTEESRGFGFVEMPSRTAAIQAMTEMDGKEIMGRPIRVNEARPMIRKEGPRGGGGGFNSFRPSGGRPGGGRPGGGGGRRKPGGGSRKGGKGRFNKRDY